MVLPARLPGGRAVSDRDHARIDRMVVRAVNRDLVAGMVVGVVESGALQHLTTIGSARIEDGVLVTPDTVFRIGSISKTVTAIAIMQLCERGEVDLDDDVTRHLPDIRIENRHAEPLRVRHLLTHTGGIGELRRLSDFFRPVAGLAVPRGRRPPSLPEYYRRGLTVETRPGTQWSYANHGFSLLGHVVENVSGRSFEEYAAEHVFRPLGMDSSSFVLTDGLRPRLATGYRYAAGHFVAEPYYEIAVRPAGSMFSTASDMARYAIALLNQGRNRHGAVLEPDTVARMLAPVFQLHPRLPAMGLSFFLDEADGFRSARHDGGWPGFASSMVLTPDEGLGVFALCNTSGMLPLSLAPGLTRRLLGVESARRRLRRAPVLKRPELWPDLVGAYHTSGGFNVNLRTWRSYGWWLRVIARGSDLVLKSPIGELQKGQPLVPIAGDDPFTFGFSAGGSMTVVTFHRDRAGKVDELRWQLNAFAKSSPSGLWRWLVRVGRLIRGDRARVRRRSLP
jgi:CubicO group peptidase (beta-lactamase class C family)